MERFPTPLDEDFSNARFDVVSLRQRLRLSQTEFAHRFGLSVATLRHWEAGERQPRGPALSLLRIIAYHPAVATRAIARCRRAWQACPEPELKPRILPAPHLAPVAVTDEEDL